MLKFDVSDKRPSLYQAWLLTGILGVVMAILLIQNEKRTVIAASIILIVYFAFLSIMLMRAFILQIRFNPYSYNTIYYMGFFLFFLSVEIMMLLRLGWTFPYMTEGSLIANSPFNILAGGAKNYIIFSSPFLLCYAILLCASNISLIRHEGKRVVNMLGIILAILMLGGVVLLFKVDYYVMGSTLQIMIHDIIVQVYSSFFLYFECMLIGAIVAGLIAARYEPEPDKDFIIILGCGIRKDGTPTPLLRGRIDRAVDFARRQKEKTGKDVIFVTSGGQGPNEVTSESACMKRYLMEQGIPGSRIIEEDRSTSTYENMKYSRAKIDAVDPAGKVAFSTTNYHVFRSGLFARRVGMRAVGMGAGTKWYFWPNAFVREFVGLLTENKKKQVLILCVILVVNIGMTLAVSSH